MNWIESHNSIGDIWGVMGKVNIKHTEGNIMREESMGAWDQSGYNTK